MGGSAYSFSSGSRRALPAFAVALLALVLAGCEAIGFGGGDDAAEEYPSRDIEHVVPLPAGGGTDTVTQLFNAPLEEAMGVNVSTVIRDGGAGATGVNHLLGQEPDGHTIMTVPPDVLSTGPVGNPDVAYDPEEDLRPVAGITSDPWVMLASVESGIETFDDFLQRAEEDPSGLTIGVSTVMGSDHYAWLLIERNLDFPGFTYVTYGGGGPYMRAVYGAEVDLVLHLEASIDPDLVIPLVVMSDEPLEGQPDVPTTDDVGFEDAYASLWQGIVIHPDTPDDVAAAVEERVLSAAQSDAFRQAASDIDITAVAMDSDEFAELAATERELARDVVEVIEDLRVEEGEDPGE